MRALILCAVLLTGCASMDNDKRDAYIAGAADCGTTALGLAVGRGIAEANPAGPIVACAIKPLVVEYAARKPEPARTESLHAAEAIWDGLAVNNAVATVIALAHAAVPWMVPVSIGIATAVYQWHRGENERIYAAWCADWKAQNPANYCGPFEPGVAMSPH